MSNHRIRKVTVSTDIISTVAGNGTAGYSGENCTATSAELNSPHGVVLDTSGKTVCCFYSSLYSLHCPPGSIYIADTLNNRIRKVHRCLILHNTCILHNISHLIRNAL